MRNELEGQTDAHSYAALVSSVIHCALSPVNRGEVTHGQADDHGTPEQSILGAKLTNPRKGVEYRVHWTAGA